MQEIEQAPIFDGFDPGEKTKDKYYERLVELYWDKKQKDEDTLGRPCSKWKEASERGTFYLNSFDRQQVDVIFRKMANLTLERGGAYVELAPLQI